MNDYYVTITNPVHHKIDLLKQKNGNIATVNTKIETTRKPAIEYRHRPKSSK
jgi:hypothetical protein